MPVITAASAGMGAGAWPLGCWRIRQAWHRAFAVAAEGHYEHPAWAGGRGRGCDGRAGPADGGVPPEQRLLGSDSGRLADEGQAFGRVAARQRPGPPGVPRVHEDKGSGKLPSLSFAWVTASSPEPSTPWRFTQHREDEKVHYRSCSARRHGPYPC